MLDAGTALVWLVYPDLQIVDLHSRGGVSSLGAGDRLSGGDVLPGFDIPVSEIFPAPASR